MAARVLEQVAREPPQQPRIAAHGRRSAGHLRLAAGALLGHEAQEVHLLGPLERLRRLEPAGQQQLADQLVQLRDVALDPGAQLGAPGTAGASGASWPRANT